MIGRTLGHYEITTPLGQQAPLGNRFLAGFVRSVLWLRYRVRAMGLKEVVERGRTGILFLQNHPALIDPVIVASQLLGTFHPRPLGDETQLDRFFLRWMARRINVLLIPDPAKVGTAGRDRIEAALDEIVKSLRRGQNVLLSPAGRRASSRPTRRAGQCLTGTSSRPSMHSVLSLRRCRASAWASCCRPAWVPTSCFSRRCSPARHP